MNIFKSFHTIARGDSPRFRAVYGAIGLALLAIAAAPNSQAVTIQSQISIVTPGINPVYQAVYTVTGADFRDTSSVVDELAIQFPAATFATLSNGVAPSSFDLLLFQPNNPAGADGIYSALAKTDHAGTAGTFSVNFTLSIPSAMFTPSTLMQVYFINEYDNNPQDSNFGALLRSTSGSVTPFVPTGGAPEPASLVLMFSAALSGGFCYRARKRRHGEAPPEF